MDDSKPITIINDEHPLTADELATKEKLYNKLLSVMDLSLIETISREQAKLQISEICQQLITEMHLPINLNARLRLIKSINDEVLGLGPLEPYLVIQQSQIYWSTHSIVFISSATAS